MMAIKMYKVGNNYVNWLNYESKKKYTYNRLKKKTKTTVNGRQNALRGISHLKLLKNKSNKIPDIKLDNIKNYIFTNNTLYKLTCSQIVQYKSCI